MNGWLRVYLLLAGLVAVAFFLLLFTKVDVETPKSDGSLADDFIGMLFEHVGGAQAFYFMLIPIAILIFSLILLNKFIKGYENAAKN